MRYGKLRTTVAEWLDKSNLDHMIPTFIRFGQNLLEAEMRLESMIATQNIALAIGAQSFLEPSLFLELDTVRLMSADDSHVKYKPMTKREWRFFVENHLPSVDPGLPEYYARANVVETTDVSLPDTGITALTARSFVFDRPADVAYILEYSFYRKEAELVADSDTNWWLTNAEEALLYAAMAKAAVYLADDDPRIKTWLTGYELAKEALVSNDRKARRGGSKPSVNRPGD
jgi:hypothetical protein